MGQPRPAIWQKHVVHKTTSVTSPHPLEISAAAYGLRPPASSVRPSFGLPVRGGASMPPGFSVPAFSFSRSPFPVQNHRGLLAAKFRRIHAAILARSAVLRV